MIKSGYGEKIIFPEYKYIANMDDDRAKGMLNRLYYVRKKAGTICLRELYEINVQGFFYIQNGSNKNEYLRICRELNDFFGFEFVTVLNKDSDIIEEIAVMTNYEFRFLIDALLADVIKDNQMPVNLALYANPLIKKEGGYSDFQVKFKPLKKWNEVIKKCEREERKHYYDSLFKRFSWIKAYEKATEGKWTDCIWKYGEIEKVLKEDGGRFNFAGSYFLYNITIKNQTIKKGLNFSGCIFGGRVEFLDCIFDFRDMEEGEITFRNAVFQQDFLMKNVVMLSNSELDFSMEDVQFRRKDRGYEGSVRFECVDFQLIQISFLQTKFGVAEVIFNNCKLQKSHLNFAGSFLENSLKIVGVDEIPECDFNFTYACDFYIGNSVLGKDIQISNVGRFRLVATEVRGKIYSKDKWDREDDVKKLAEKEVLRGRTFYKYPKGTHPLLYSCRNKEENDGLAQEFLILKKNFKEQGNFEQEDNAFLLYLRYKERKIKCLYYILDFVGDYGLEPKKILKIYITVVVTYILIILGYERLNNSCLHFEWRIALQYLLQIFLAVQKQEDKSMLIQVTAVVYNGLTWFLQNFFMVSLVRKILR